MTAWAIEPANVGAAAARTQDAGYVDIAQLASEYVRRRSAGYGPAHGVHALQSREISDRIITEQWLCSATPFVISTR